MIIGWKLSIVLSIVLLLMMGRKSEITSNSVDSFLNKTVHHGINTRDRKNVSAPSVHTLILPNGDTDCYFQKNSIWVTIQAQKKSGKKQSCKRDKLKIFFVPHSVNYPGWKKSYFLVKSRKILHNILYSLSRDPELKFVWSDVSVLSKFWVDASNDTRSLIRKLIDNGQLEIVTGGLVENDDANSHYFGILLQLIIGHNWLFHNLDYRPKNGWMVGSFGHSPTTAFFLRKMGIQNLVINRINFGIKEYLLKTKNLEFYWRQTWDTSNSTDLFTLVLPFHYNVSYCVFSPKNPCKSHLSIDPYIIESGDGVDKKLDEFRNYSRNIHGNVILLPLGTEFSFVDSKDTMEVIERFSVFIDLVRRYFNDSAEVQFGTLNDYFKERFEHCPSVNFKSLSGNFFTYTDSPYDYWSGIYMARPFYKRKERILLNFIRAAEILYGLAWNAEKNLVGGNWLLSKKSNIYNHLSEARRSISIFQHYIAISGTSGGKVVLDYAESLNYAVNILQRIMQESVYFLLFKHKHYLYEPKNNNIYFYVDAWYSEINELPKDFVINLNRESHVKRLVIFNSLTWKRRELISVSLSSPNFKVFSSNGKEILCQTIPRFLDFETMSEHVFTLSFIVEIKALSLDTFYLQLIEPHGGLKSNVHSKITFFKQRSKIPSPNITYFHDFEVKFTDLSEFVLSNHFIKVTFSKYGLLQTISLRNNNYSSMPVNIYFVVYETYDAGPHIFRPKDFARILMANNTYVRVMVGPLFSQVDVEFNIIRHTIRIHNTKCIPSFGLEIQNFVNWQVNNSAIAMRIYSGIKSGDKFFTDLNGFQMVRRRRIYNLGISGNYYPMSTAAYVEDEDHRLTLLSGQPGGFTSLKEGQMEVMLDRRNGYDDEENLAEGVVGNIAYINVLHLILEKREVNCKDAKDKKGFGSLSPYAILLSYSILYPLIRFFSAVEEERELMSQFSGITHDMGSDLHLVSMFTLRRKSGHKIGFILHRMAINKCFQAEEQYFVSKNGYVNLSSLFGSNLNGKIKPSSLSFLQLRKSECNGETEYIDTMDVKAYLM